MGVVLILCLDSFQEAIFPPTVLGKRLKLNTNGNENASCMFTITQSHSLGLKLKPKPLSEAARPQTSHGTSQASIRSKDRKDLLYFSAQHKHTSLL